jgi:Na+/H+-translocating membrane pyrophosphatase
MAADLFETYVVTVGATMVLIALLVLGVTDTGLFLNLMSWPLLIGGTQRVLHELIRTHRSTTPTRYHQCCLHHRR